jgi:hypothetical protein
MPQNPTLLYCQGEAALTHLFFPLEQLMAANGYISTKSSWNARSKWNEEQISKDWGR